jgi:hypothetical protein
MKNSKGHASPWIQKPFASKKIAPTGLTVNHENRLVFDMKFNFENLGKENKKLNDFLRNQPIFLKIDWFSDLSIDF